MRRELEQVVSECEDMGPLPVEHPRERLYASARLALRQLWVGWIEAHDLTRAEELALLAELVSERAQAAVACERRQK